MRMFDVYAGFSLNALSKPNISCLPKGLLQKLFRFNIVTPLTFCKQLIIFIAFFVIQTIISIDSPRSIGFLPGN